jgi:hypothetical protein
MRHRVRSLFTLTSIGALLLCGPLAASVLAAPAGGVKGDPQPELKMFRISKADSSPATIAFEPNGSMVAAYQIPFKSFGKIVVCTLSRGQRACSHTVALNTLSGDGWISTDAPQVLVPSANHVVVLDDSCCDTAANGDTLLFSSTDGGRTFGAAARIGSVVVGGAVLIGGQIVFIGSDFPQGVQVASVPVGASGPPSAVATLTPNRGDVGIGSYHGGVLAAFDYDGKIFSTSVDYAPSGSNFNASGSYHRVINISNESLLAASGSALLTVQTAGKQVAVELRLFNGKSFGPPHAVPGASGGGPEWFGLQQDPSGVTHVFSERANTGYDLVELSTANGKGWKSANLGNAINSSSFAAGLDSHGTGLILGAGGSQVNAYPVLQAQAVSFSLKSSTIKRGTSTTASGTVKPAGPGRVVTLQVERGGAWYNVATTKEKGGGSFSFTIKGTSSGTFSYRAVVSDLAGYLMFGYSAARTLHVS